MPDSELRHEPKREPRAATRTERTLTNWLWMSFGVGAQGVLTVVVIAVLARLLTPEQFGQVSAGLLVIKLSLIFSQGGVSQAIVQHPELRPEHIRSGHVLSIAGGALYFLVLWIAAPYIAASISSRALTPIVRALSWTLLLQGASRVAEGLLRRDLRFRTIASIRVVSYTLGYALVGIVVAMLGGGVWALVAAQITQTALATVLFIVQRPHDWRPLFDRPAMRELTTFGGGLTLARVGNYAALNGDYFVVVKWLGTTALGLYERAYQLMAMPATLIGQALDDVLFPAMAQIQHDVSRVGNAYRRVIAAVGIISLPISVVAVVLAPEIVHIILGHRWSEAIGPFQVLAAGTLFRSSYKISDSLTRALGAVYERAWRQWIYAALVVGGGLLGRPWGITGVSIGVLFALLINFLLMAQLSIRLLGVHWTDFLVAHAPGVRLALIVGVPTYLVAWATRGPLRLPEPAVLVLSLAAALLASGGALRLVAHRLLGPDGRWLLQRLTGMFTRGFGTLRPRPAAHPET